MSQLSVSGNGLATFTVRFDVIHGAILEGMDLVVANSTSVRLLPERDSEVVVEKPRLGDSPVEYWLHEFSEFVERNLGLQ